MAQEGWSWRLEHDANQHTLVIFDELAAVPDVGALRFGRTDWRSASGHGEDKITAWSVGQQVGPNAVTLAAWDERQTSGVGCQCRRLDPTRQCAPHWKATWGHGERRFADGRVSDAPHASPKPPMRVPAPGWPRTTCCNAVPKGHSAVRTLREGAAFAITEHSLYDGGADNHFKVISITHEAANNLGAEAAKILQTSDLDEGSYRNHFQAVPADVRLVPLPAAPCMAPGPQTAIVVTAVHSNVSDPVTTDRDGRAHPVLWQRGTAPINGGLTGPNTVGAQSTGHAPGDASSGTWGACGPRCGGSQLGRGVHTRAGTEVLVDFVDGDIDRPIIVGQLHNGQHDLPWPAGEDSGANHIGAISGWHMPHLDGGGASQWLVDDSQGQLRMRLATHGSRGGWSELSLGHIIAHSGNGGAGHAQRGAWLGEGFYGHTDGWAIVRRPRPAAQHYRPHGTRCQRAKHPDGRHRGCGSTQSRPATGPSLEPKRTTTRRPSPARLRCPTSRAMRHTDAMCAQAQGKHSGSVNGQEAKSQGSHPGRPRRKVCQTLGAP